MDRRIRAPKDFGAGLIYVAVGSAVLLMNQAYTVGPASRMGPGYFPRLLAILLLLIGAFALARSFISSGEEIQPVAWRPLVLVSLATGLFGYLLLRAGAVVALSVLCLLAALASRRFPLGWRAAIGVAGLVAFCLLVFVKALGVPLPLAGRWLQ